MSLVPGATLLDAIGRRMIDPDTGKFLVHDPAADACCDQLVDCGDCPGGAPEQYQVNFEGITIDHSCDGWRTYHGGGGSSGQFTVSYTGQNPQGHCIYWSSQLGTSTCKHWIWGSNCGVFSYEETYPVFVMLIIAWVGGLLYVVDLLWGAYRAEYGVWPWGWFEAHNNYIASDNCNGPVPVTDIATTCPLQPGCGGSAIVEA